jgi:PQQ-like domain
MGAMPEEDVAAPTKVDERVTEPAGTSRSDAALAAYRRRMRALRILYAAGIAAVVAIALVLVKIAYDHGEISHAHLHTAQAPPSLATAPTPAATPRRAWSNTDVTAIGAPAVGGTVVTHDTHTVRGRDARTGAQTWSYTRTDRTVCTAIQAQSVTIAVYRLGGNCDELTAVDSETGARLWTRTLDKDGAVFDGPATYAVNGGTVMFVSPTSVYTIASGGSADEGNGGLDYWVFHHTGCTINSAVLGNSGALISQTCHGQDCKGHKFCGDGTQLLLRDQTAGTDDKSTDNPDVVKWNHLGSDLIPTSAGLTVTARDADGATLHVFDPESGKQTAQLALSGDSGSSAPFGFASATDADLIWIGARTYALASKGTSFAWTAPTTGVPTVADSAAVLSGDHAFAPTSSGAVLLNGSTGSPTTRYPIAPPASGSRVFALGTGLLVAGPRTVAYR